MPCPYLDSKFSIFGDVRDLDEGEFGVAGGVITNWDGEGGGESTSDKVRDLDGGGFGWAGGFTVAGVEAQSQRHV